MLVRFRPNASEQDKEIAAISHGAHRRRRLRGDSAVEKFELATSRDAASVALQLNLNPAVEFAEPNFIVKSDQLGVTANDPRFADLWALRNTGQNGGQFGSDVNATKAWETTTGSVRTVIAIVDSGVDFTHPDLSDNQWTNPNPVNGDEHGWDFIRDNGTIQDEQGHGTAVAGIIAAQGNNSTGTSGVMWRASLMSLRVLDETGTGDVAAAVEAIDYAVAHGAQVINLSWGTEGQSIVLKDAIDRALRRGVSVVCSAGNSSRNLDDGLSSSAYYPASFDLPGLIAVAATNNRDQLETWSNYGPMHVTVAAPGTDILTTQRGGGYWNVSGTSAAAPLVTGVVGLMKTLRPTLNTRQIRNTVTDSARRSASLSGKVLSEGVVDAAKAIRNLPRGNGVSGEAPRPRYGSGGTGPGGSFNTTPPQVSNGAPGSNLPNLDQVRNSTPQTPRARTPVQSNLICGDCDPQSGGGGGSYYPTNDPNFSSARRRPTYETGTPGVDLGSRNFNWSLPLLSLAGRAGMDLNLELAYNSLVWTKDGSYIKYNGDLGSPAPGFRLGLPTLQQRFLNSQTGLYAYMMVTPSGGRIELRQVGTSNIYESQDGSYTQLDATNPNALLVRTTDGTQFTFVPVTINSEYRCTQIKDRNGNYISAAYDTNNGHLQTVTDTLGRVISFVYDANSNLESIRQTWAGVSHDWATFSYGQVWVAPNFGGGLLINGPNNNYVTVLTQVSLHDGSYFTFNYNAAFGQVNRINHYAPDGHLRAYTSYNVDSSAGQTDCPRFTERRDWAENWNSNNEAVTGYSVAPDASWSQQTAPDGTIHKEFFATTGWQTGLTTGTEVWFSGVKKKWTTAAWTQDDINLGYSKNPRVYDASIYDEAGNRRRTEIIYTTYYWPNAISLPTEIREYAADAVTVLRKTSNTHFISQAYIDRRVLGLLRETIVYDQINQPVSKVWYDYDWGNDYWAATSQPATQHDATGDQSGRGNLCWVGRWDVSDANNFAKSTRQYIKYNRTGAVIRAEDHYGHGKTISYADSFSDSINRNTFAYPTSVTDEDGFVSTSQYRYDLGAVTRLQDPKGATQTITYDAAGRVDRVTLTNNGAYTRYVYNPYGDIVSFSTIHDGAGEAFSVRYFDGAGRLRSAGSDLPNSSSGYRGQFWIYDNMGRLWHQTNPAEMSGSWVPSGDDAAGWVLTFQNYDWQGRPTVTTNPDGSTRENTYGGCGCAGGEVTTARDERGRRRRLSKDVLGRLKQVEELNWDTSVYSTTTYAYNARDQITQINQAGQLRTFGYDGHGRLQSRTTPEQGATTYSYFADDTVETITDARGATTTFGYNNRHLPESISYGVPAGVAATANVSFGYDEAGNRTSMTDGLGSASYGFNALSQMTSETRTITGVGSFSMSYGYNLSGELTRITNPWNVLVEYDYDKIGRPKEITGAGYAGVSSYVSSVGYRAFGAKQMSYANGKTLSLQYDTRMRLTRWDVPGAMGWNYSYNNFGENGGRVTYAQNLYDATLDRSYDYDHVGRLLDAHTGSEARGALVGTGGAQDGPYSQSYRYDQFGNIWYRVGWGGSHGSWLEESPSFTGNRRNGLSYDAAGNLSNDGSQSYSYDATNQQTYASATALSQNYDGDGLRAKKTENGTTTYYLRSSVLGGQVVAEISATGTWNRGYVYLGGQIVALQYNGSVSWVHQDPVTKSQRVTNSSGAVTSTIDLDPWGGDTNRSSNQAFQPQRYTTYTRDSNGGDDAMMRRYQPTSNRFNQPDPYDGSYNLADPQSFNRYAYVQNDPVNFVDPSGLCSWRATLNPDGSIGRTEWLTPCNVNSNGGSSGGGGRGFDSLFSDVRPTPITEFEWRYSAGRASFGGGGGGPNPEPPTGERQGQESYAAKVAGCYARCLTKNRQDNVIREIGNAAGYPRVGEFAAELTIAGTAAATVNQALNLTSLGRYPRGGAGGGSRAGMPTTWQHRLGGALGRHVGSPMIGRFARGLGRGSNALGIGMLVAEGSWWQGIQTACAVLCARDPSCY